MDWLAVLLGIAASVVSSTVFGLVAVPLFLRLIDHRFNVALEAERSRLEWEAERKRRAIDEFGRVLRILTSANQFPAEAPQDRDAADKSIERWREPYWKFMLTAPAELVQALSHFTDQRGGHSFRDERQPLVAVRKWVLGAGDPVTADQLLTELLPALRVTRVAGEVLAKAPPSTPSL